MFSRAGITIGTKLFSGLNGTDLYTWALSVSVLELVIRSVWPSAGARATKSAAMLPLAPALFSTSTGWPSARASSGAMVRAIASIDPPAGTVTTRFTAFEGNCCATAIDCTIARNANATMRMTVEPPVIISSLLYSQPWEPL